MNAKYLAVELDQMPEGAALRAELAKVSHFWCLEAQDLQVYSCYKMPVSCRGLCANAKLQPGKGHACSYMMCHRHLLDTIVVRGPKSTLAVA